MHMDRHVQSGAAFPHDVVFRVVIRLVIHPHGRDGDAAAQAHLVSFFHHLGCPIHIEHHRHKCHSRSAQGAVGAKLCQPAVVGFCSGESQVAFEFPGGPDACPERRAGRARDGVGVGEHDFSHDAVVVQLFVAGGCVPAAGVALLGSPLFLVLLVAHPGFGSGCQRGFALGEEVVQSCVVFGVQIGPILLGRKPSVAVGRDDGVVIVVL